jgi:hypothetical protein
MEKGEISYPEPQLFPIATGSDPAVTLFRRLLAAAFGLTVSLMLAATGVAQAAPQPHHVAHHRTHAVVRHHVVRHHVVRHHVVRHHVVRHRVVHHKVMHHTPARKG